MISAIICAWASSGPVRSATSSPSPDRLSDALYVAEPRRTIIAIVVTIIVVILFENEATLEWIVIGRTERRRHVIVGTAG